RSALGARGGRDPRALHRQPGRDREGKLAPMGDAPNFDTKPATSHTAAANAAAAALPFLAPGADPDRERARRGLVARPSSPTVDHALGWPVWNLDEFACLEGDPPPEVHPSLWRQ